MPKTYEPISTQTLSSAVTGVTFTSIPQTYTDLVLVINASASTAANAWLSTNLTDVSSLSGTRLYADGTGAGTARTSSGNDFVVFTAYDQVTTTAGNFNAVLNFMSYANTTTNKTIITRSNNASAGVCAAVCMERKTGAITSITIDMVGTGTYSIGSTFTLYGIKAA